MIPFNHLLTILTTYEQNVQILYLPNDLLSLLLYYWVHIWFSLFL